MIFRTLDELKLYFNFTNEFEIDDIIPHMESSLEKYIYPYLSKAQYAALDANYGLSTPTNADKALLPYVQGALLSIALHKYSFHGDKKIGVSGISTNVTDEDKMVAQWRVEDLRDRTLTEYDERMDNMLIFLEANKATYVSWASSTSYSIFKECFINNTEEFSLLFNVDNSRRTFLSLRGIMKRVEELNIRNITGTALFNQIKTQIVANSLTAQNILLLNYIKPAVACHTGARACTEFAFSVRNSGLVINSKSSSLTENVKTSPDQNFIEKRKAQAEIDGNIYCDNLRKYLYANHATYPLYEADSTVYNPTAVGTDINSSSHSLFI